MIYFFQYLLIAVVAFCGVILGRILFFIAPEELKPGRKWLRICSALTFAISLILSFRVSIFRILIAIAGFSIIFWFPKFIGKDIFMQKAFISVIAFASGFVYAFSNNYGLSGSLLFVFFIFFSGFVLHVNPKDVNVKKGIVKQKIRYLKGVILPMLSYFVSILAYFIF